MKDIRASSQLPAVDPGSPMETLVAISSVEDVHRELTAAISELIDESELLTPTWVARIHAAAGVFRQATPWPGTAAEAEQMVTDTLDEVGVPSRQRSAVRLFLLPAE